VLSCDKLSPLSVSGLEGTLASGSGDGTLMGLGKGDDLPVGQINDNLKKTHNQRISGGSKIQKQNRRLFFMKLDRWMD
jgi:hypothetical protein